MSIPEYISELAKALSEKQTRDFRKQLESIYSLQSKLYNQIQALSTSIEIPSILSTSIKPLIHEFGSTSQILESIRSLTEISEPYIAQYKDFFSSIEKSLRIPIADITSTSIAFDSLYLSKAFERLKKRLKLDELTVEAYKASGWPIAPSMPEDLRDRIIAFYNQGKAGYASNSILGHYRRDNYKKLIDAVNGWESNELFLPRMHIMRDALRAHCEGTYTLSVPSLMPQVEGILIDYVNANDLNVSIRKIQDVYEAAIGDPLEYELPKWLIASTLLSQLNNSTYVFTDFEQELRKSSSRRRITRHTVLHGIAPNYDRPINSLRIFTLLDALSGLQSI